MTAYEIIELYTLCGQEIDTSWNFFITVHIAILGAFFMSNNLKTIKFINIVIFISAYAAFMLMNVRSLICSYELYYSILSDIQAGGIAIPDNIKLYFQNAKITDRTTVACVIYGVTGLISLGLLLSRCPTIQTWIGKGAIQNKELAPVSLPREC